MIVIFKPPATSKVENILAKVRSVPALSAIMNITKELMNPNELPIALSTDLPKASR